MAKNKIPRGSKHHNTSLRESDIVTIRRLAAEGIPQTGIRERYNGLSAAACSNIIARKTWKHVTERSGDSVIHYEEYHIWNSMLQRCNNSKHISYPEYGGRGIRVSEEWHSFPNFLADMGKRPSKDHSLDRKDANGHYCKGNVTWETTKRQARNKRNTVMLPHPTTGVLTAAADIAEELGISYHKFRHQMKKEGKWPNTFYSLADK